MDPSASRNLGENEQSRPTGQHAKSVKFTARKKDVPASNRLGPPPPPPVGRPVSNTARKTGGIAAAVGLPRNSSGTTHVRFEAGPSGANRSAGLPGPGPLRATKQSGSRQVPPAPRPPTADNRNAAPRQLMRKSASVVPTSQKRSHPSFDYVAPPVPPRETKKPTKTVPGKPLFLALADLAMKTAAKEDGWDDATVSRSAPRMSTAAMSVQRRAGVSPRKAAGRAQDSPTKRKEAPPGRVQPAHTEEEESPSSSETSGESDDIPPRMRFPQRIQGSRTRAGLHQTAAKVARKQVIPADRPARPHGKAARKLDLPSDDEPIEISDSDEDIDELLDAFDALTLGPLRLQQRRRLPFLLPNLWVGFEERCARAGVRTYPEEKPQRPVEVVYRYYPNGYDEGEDSSDEEQEYQEWVGSMTEWCCPLCQLHEPFKTRDVLAFHLRRDHSEVQVSWTQTGPKTARAWRIKLVLPDYDELEESTSEEDEGEDEDLDFKPIMDDVGISPEPARDTTPSPVSSPPHVPLFLPGSDDEESPSPATPPSEAKVEEQKPKVLDPEPEPSEARRSLSAVSGATRENRPRTSTAVVTSYRGSLPPRYPSPPPPTDPLGPAAQYPFIPGTNADGQEVYSCRISGPRIYDLLNELPLDEFGIMSWAIVDREEELFEMDDVRDEDKVMLALWNRWMMLNKTAFIFHDYLQGVKSFLDQYWKFIHKAAGWRALRSFLLMLNVNKYLSLAQILDALKYYESKTGMDLWYKEEAEAGADE